MFATSLADTCPIFQGFVVNKLQQFLRTWFHIRGISSTSILIMVYLGAAISKNSWFGTRIEDSSASIQFHDGEMIPPMMGFQYFQCFLNTWMGWTWVDFWRQLTKIVLYRILVQKRGDGFGIRFAAVASKLAPASWPHLASYFPGSWESWVPPVLPGPPMMLRRALWFWTASPLPRRETISWDAMGHHWAARCPLSHIDWTLNIIDRVSMSYVSYVSYVFSAIVFSCLLQDFQLDFFRLFGCSS